MNAMDTSEQVIELAREIFIRRSGLYKSYYGMEEARNALDSAKLFYRVIDEQGVAGKQELNEGVTP